MTNINLKDFDAAVFDLEGTLANTIPTHHRTRAEAFEQFGFGHITKEQHAMGPTYGSSHTDILGGILFAAGEITDEVPFSKNQTVLDIIAAKGALFKTAAAEGFDAMPGAIDFIHKIAPHFLGNMAIVTSSEEEFIFPFITRYNLGQYFPANHVIGHESVVSAGLQVKPSGDPYRLGMERLGTENIIVFEDTIPGVASAKKAGATVVALAFDKHTSHLLSGDLKYKPDLVVSDYYEASELLQLN